MTQIDCREEYWRHDRGEDVARRAPYRLCPFMFSAIAVIAAMTIPGCGGDVLITQEGGSCNAPAALCGGVCVDTSVDPTNCGSCGNACAPAEVCSVGQCGLVCLGGATRCGDACVDMNLDPANCGACGNACADGELCSAGSCGLVCLGGATKCGDACVDTNLDPANCGVCGNVCPTGDVCSAGSCGMQCPAGETFCGGQCVDTGVDKDNCGACGNACATSDVCSLGNCVAPSCADPPGLQSGKMSIAGSAALVPLCNGKVVIGNTVQNRIEIVDIKSATVQKSIQVSAAPGDIVVDPLTGIAYVAFGSATQVAKVDLNAETVTPIPLSKAANRLTLGPPDTIFAIADGSIVMIDGPTASVAATMPINFGDLITFDKQGSQFVVGNQGGSPSRLRRYAFDAAAKTATLVQERWDVGSNGQDLAMSADGGHVAFACGGGNGNGYAITDFSSNDLSVTFGSWNTDAYPRAAAFSPNGKRFLGSNGFDVMLFDAKTHVLIKQYKDVFPNCFSGIRLAFSPASGLHYVLGCGKLLWFVP